MEYKVDYHVHTWCSDGEMKPAELIREFHDNEYDIVAITDHDGVDGVEEAKIAGEALKMMVVAGIELATEYEGKELHILGYNIDIENDELLDKIDEIKEFRDERNEKLLAVLNEMGYELAEEDLKTRRKQNFIGKPHFAKALVKKGYIQEYKEAFEPGKFLESPQAKAVEKKMISTKEAIDVLKAAGGMGVLAHPMKIKKLGERGSDEFWTNLDQLLRELKKMGLKGIECIYPDHSDKEMSKLSMLAGKYHLHMTEGSDFHGDKEEVGK